MSGSGSRFPIETTAAFEQLPPQRYLTSFRKSCSWLPDPADWSTCPHLRRTHTHRTFHTSARYRSLAVLCRALHGIRLAPMALAERGDAPLQRLVAVVPPRRLRYRKLRDAVVAACIDGLEQHRDGKDRRILLVPELDAFLWRIGCRPTHLSDCHMPARHEQPAPFA